ncbi:MAG: YncE family protein [Anaerolineae bacterium]
MFKSAMKPRIIYLVSIAIISAIILTLATSNLLRKEDETGPVESSQVQAEPTAAPPAEEVVITEPGPEYAGDPAANHHSSKFPEVEPVYEKVVSQGVSVEFTVESRSNISPVEAILEAEYVLLKFNVTDASSGAALSNLGPSAWMDVHPQATGDGNDAGPACEDKVQLYLRGTLGARPDIDLNGYFILALNNDGSISVIDPMIDVGGMTQLYKMMMLARPGEDWAMSRDDRTLLVTMPRTGQVAVVDTEGFEVKKNLDVGSNPVRIAFQPDEAYAWVGHDSVVESESGVTVIDAAELSIAAHIPTGPGRHELAFSADGRFAYVTNDTAGTLSIIDARKLEKIKDIPLGKLPVDVAVSAASGAVYVVGREAGIITVVDGQTHKAITEIVATPGLSAVRFTPDGRWGFAANPQDGRVYIFDATANRIAYQVAVGGTPDQVSFGDTFAYVRSKEATEVTAIALADLGQEGSLPVVTIPVGQRAPAASAFDSVADAMFPAPGEDALLIANPADGLIYYYVEGARAPMGSFQGHGRAPRAIQVVDRSLREEVPGLYTGKVRLPASGEYQVAFLLDSPRVVHCFTFTAKPNPALAKRREEAPPTLEFVSQVREIKPDEDLSLQFTLADPTTNEPLAGLEDVLALVTNVSSNWNQRLEATPVENGLYEVTISALRPGLYKVFFAAPSLQVNYDGFPDYTFQVKEETASK